jgi:hypothetical protein
MTEANKLALWEKLGRTDPAHTKGFQRAGGFKGTAIKPIYTEHKMTEEFGPCGVGWGFSDPQFQVVPGSDGQVAVYCWLSVWFNYEGKISAPVHGVGGDMVVVKQSAGLRTDDEAFKKAFTDAIGNAMKHIGMSADVHMGLFDDSKYVAEAKAGAQIAASRGTGQLSAYRAKQLLKTDVLLDAIDTAKTTKRCDELDGILTGELSFLPAEWLTQFQDRIKLRRKELGGEEVTRPEVVDPNATLDRQFADTMGPA